jgi:GNAT superfamily N-acetyltransferase
MRGRVDRAAGAGELVAGLTIRPIDVRDEVDLGMLMAAAYRGTIDDPGEDDAWFQADARATLQGRHGVLLEDASVVAVDEEELLVGTCAVTDDGPHLLPAFALVAPRWQNRGVGTALIGASANMLRARGHHEWTLAVTEGSPARRLYERLGFQADLSLRCRVARSATR